MGAHHSGKTCSPPQNLSIDHDDQYLPIEGYEKMPIVSLEVAVEPLTCLLPSIQTYVRLAKQKCTNPADNLTQDESASIMLCTMRWQPLDQCLSVALNTVLRSTDRQKLKPWLLYLKLLIKALNRLPSVHRTIFRGIKLDVTTLYRKDKTIAWYDFSLCSNSIDLLHSDKYLGTKGPRTIFSIECNSSKDISKHLYCPSKDMILLPAATLLKVIQCSKQNNDLHWIQLKEVQSPLIQAQSISCLATNQQDFMYSYSIPFAIPPIETTPPSIDNNEPDENKKLERLIDAHPVNSRIHLRLRKISTNGMNIINQQAIVNKKCTELWLYNCQITSYGALILSNGLYNNKILRKLNLNDNNIRDQGVYYLARVLLINNSTLKELHLARNEITSKGTPYLADMLNTNKTLTTLNLYGNKIDNHGIKYLTHALSYYNTTLEDLYLSGNNLMTDLSIGYFIDMLRENQSLKKLHLFNCNLSDKGKSQLRETVRMKTNFILNI